jgi:phosphoribosylanthranilate isomerase
MKIKICGITNIDDAVYCENKGVDALGFIFYEKSKRYVEVDKAAEIIKKLNPFTLKVGVFVNKNAEEINFISKKIGLSIVQLHGDEDENIYKLLNLPVIKAIRIKSEIDIANALNCKANFVLLDKFKENIYGGTGETFDYEIVPVELWKRVIIAGGIDANNINNILDANILPAAIDLSSGVEEYPGKKDYKKIDLLMNNINRRRNEC